MATSTFRWTYDTLTPGLRTFPARLHLGIAAIMKREESLAESQMRAEAPWTDRSGAARAGLGARYEKDALVHRLYLYHSVEYGIWLELMQSGRFAVVTPQLGKSGARIMSQCNGLLGKLGGIAV